MIGDINGDGRDDMIGFSNNSIDFALSEIIDDKPKYNNL